MKVSPSISFLSKAAFVWFPLSILIAKPTRHSLYAMGFSFTTSVGPNVIVDFRAFFLLTCSSVALSSFPLLSLFLGQPPLVHNSVVNPSRSTTVFAITTAPSSALSNRFGVS